MARILIVDDDPDVVEACKLFLERDSHEIATAYSREEGMASVGSFKPDLLILDVVMEQPDDGIAMAQELRRQGFAKPILMLTSIGRVTGLSYGRDAELVPVDVFLEKPADPTTLRRLVGELLAGKGGS